MEGCGLHMASHMARSKVHFNPSLKPCVEVPSDNLVNVEVSTLANMRYLEALTKVGSFSLKEYNRNILINL